MGVKNPRYLFCFVQVTAKKTRRGGMGVVRSNQGARVLLYCIIVWFLNILFIDHCINKSKQVVELVESASNNHWDLGSIPRSPHKPHKSGRQVSPNTNLMVKR